MIFFDVNYLFLLFIPLIFSCFIFYSLYKSNKSLNVLFNHNIHDKVVPSYSIRRKIAQGLLAILAISSLIISIADPALIRENNKLNTSNVNTMFVLDVSKSMNANDVEPNRFQKAKFFINEFLNEYKGLAGLIVFAGESVVQVPLTKDYELIKNNLSYIKPGFLEIQGSDLNNVLRLSSQVFYNDSVINSLILLTDGENHSNLNDDVLFNLRNKNTILFIVPIGTEKGSFIPEEGSFIKDSTGKNVVSKVNMKVLAELTLKTEGYLLENNFKTLTERLLSDRRYTKENRELTTINLRSYFLLLSVLFIFTNFLVQFVRRKND